MTIRGRYSPPLDPSTIIDWTAATENLYTTGTGTFSDLSAGTITGTDAGYSIVQDDGTREVGFYTNADGGWVGTKSNHPLNFFTNNSVALMTIGTDGNFDFKTGNFANVGTIACGAITGGAYNDVTLAVRDEASTNLNANAKTAITNLGSTEINNLGYRDSWGMISTVEEWRPRESLLIGMR